ncbi:MAG: preprotein translocase subunit SecE [Acutalibacteraceae bacterium]|nr:preprotein translocase subunit SecE [Acutalibacteraceae bacterium]
MKVINKICQILAIVFSLATVVVFFLHFATVEADGNSVKFIAAQLGFGSKVDVAGSEVDMARSAHILFCFWLSVISLVMSAFSFKAKGLRYAAPGLGLINAIYLLVIALSSEWKFIDTRPLANVTAKTYTPVALIMAIVAFVFVIFAVAYLLIDDYIEVSNSKNGALTIPKRLIRFFRDYKSEVKKIVWPGIKEVLKNTVIVLIMCALIGVVIWLVDFGLGKLIELILGA